MDYTLKRLTDANGQPRRPFGFCRENNAAKLIDQLSGICAGILADGVVCDEEAKFFHQWVREASQCEPQYPFTDILRRLDRIFGDGSVDEEERVELAEIMKIIIGDECGAMPSETKSSRLPLDDPKPSTIRFENIEFVPTGRFAFGSRSQVAAAISERKGIVKDGSPTKKTGYLVIGEFASRDWKNTNHGLKIARAVELRAKGAGICIIGEEHWKDFLL